MASIKKNLKNLHKIKPDREWVFSLKQDILGRKEVERFHLLHLHSQAFLAGSLAVVALIMVAVFGAVFFQNNGLNSFSDVDFENLTSSLRSLEEGLSEATSYLSRAQEPDKVLEMDEIVSAALKEGSQFVEETKKKTAKIAPEREIIKAEMLSALTDVESALDKMRQAQEALQKEVTGRELAELEQNSALSEAQQALLEQAKEYFEQGSYAEALIKIVELSQIR